MEQIMATYNDVTGDALVSRTLTERGAKSFDRIFGEKKKKTNGGWTPPPLPLNEYPDNGSDDWDETRIDRIGANGDGFPDKSHYETKD
jgi:hypothetical protein